MGPKILVTILIIVSLFGLHQCYDPEHPIGLERCFKKYEGKPWQLEVLCCVKDPSNCFPGFETEKCIKCPPLRKGVDASDRDGKMLPQVYGRSNVNSTSDLPLYSPEGSH